MNRSSINGWKDVFHFTLVQTLKSRVFIIPFVIMIVLMLISMPLVDMFFSSGSDDLDQPFGIKKVYVNNQTDLPDMDFSSISMEEAMGHIVFEDLTEDYNTVSDRIEQQENDSIILNIEDSEGIYTLHFVKASHGPVQRDDMVRLSDAIAGDFEYFRNNELGVTQQQLEMIHPEIAVSVFMSDMDGNPTEKVNTSISQSEYWFVYGLLFIVMMVNMMAGTQVATSIVTEKSTRVIEYLLISVKPLALMVGKILAMLTAVLIQVVSYIVILSASNALSSMLSSGSGESTMAQFLPTDIFNNLNILNIILCLVLILLGLFFYAALAGLAGATVSRLEELGEGLTLFTLTGLVGVYIGIGAANVLTGPGINGFVTFAFLFPLSSPFVLPGAILVGKTGPLLIAAAMILQVIFIILLLKFVARVFETVILHNGSTIKIKELIKLSKTVSRGETL